MGLEKKYLTKIYNLTKDHNTENDDVSVHKTTSLSDIDQNTAPLVPNTRNKLMTASDFEKQMKRTELKKDQELHNCREFFYFRRIFVIVSTLTCVGVVMIIFKAELFMLMPIYRSDECNYIINYESVNGIKKYKLTTNQVIFEVVNWAELVFLYFTTRRCMLLKQDQLNIKNELIITTLSWIGFSILYFACNIMINQSEGNSLRILVFSGILLRNLFTFYATTLMTLYAIKFKEQVEYGSD
jgi:uncharacterized membrane protein